MSDIDQLTPSHSLKGRQSGKRGSDRLINTGCNLPPNRLQVLLAADPQSHQMDGADSLKCESAPCTGLASVTQIGPVAVAVERLAR